MQIKQKRLEKILEIIASRDIETQEDLAAALADSGFNVTQATVSRDIKELKLAKTRGHGEKQKYVAMAPSSDKLSEKFVRVLRDGFVSMDQAQNILVIRTVSGMAMAVAAALDSLHFPEVVGCIAGDDTIMVAVRTVEDTTALKGRLRELV